MNLQSIFLWCAALAVLSGQVTPESYLWPLDAPPALTSTYAEYRSGRFHAGLDVKTWGKEGYACVSVADGYVWRVRTSPWGYGKAVYLKLVDGRTAVYAHLSGFVDRIESVVAAEQDRRGAYSVNLYFPPGEIPVTRGDRIAFTGSTGSGFPHLHFEIRDGQQRPLNPLLNGFGVKDTTEPTLVETAFIPLDAEARVDGRNVPAYRTMVWAEGKGFVGSPVSVWGRVGVAIKVFDRADASVLTNKLAPYRLTLAINDTAVLRTVYDSFSYDQVYEVDLERSFFLNRNGRKGFHNLYIERGNTLPLYGGRGVGSGVILAGIDSRAPGTVLEQEAYTLRITAEDAEGNRAEGIVDLTVREPVAFLGAEVKDVGNARVLGGHISRVVGEPRSLIVESSPDGRTWQWIKTARIKGARFSIPVAESLGSFYRLRFEDGPAAICAAGRVASDAPITLDVTNVMYEGRSVLSVRVSQPLRSLPTVTHQPSGPVGLIALSPRHFEGVIPESVGESRVTVRVDDHEGQTIDTVLVLETAPIRPTGGQISSRDGAAFAVFPAASIYHGFSGRITRADLPADDALLVGSAYRFDPGVIPFRNMVQVHFKVPEGEDRSRLGVYELTGRGWSFVWNDVDSTRNTVWAGVRHFSTYGLLRDDIAPDVEIRSPGDGTRTVQRPKIEVVMRDSLSGIPMETLISFEMDGETMIFAYDPEEDIAEGILRYPLSPGDHRLEVRVRDTCGNETIAISTFVVTE